MSYGPLSSFIDLPTELKLEIIANLSAKRVARMPGICNRFRDLVDENAQHIFTTVHQRELVRLQRFVRYHIFYESSTTFLEAFCRWGYHRGWSSANTAADDVEDIMSIGAFIMHWAKLHMYPDLPVATLCDLNRQATTIWRINRGFPKPYMNSLGVPTAVMDAARFVTLMTLDGKNPLRITRKECEDIYEELSTTPGGRIPGLHRDGYCGLEDAIPMHLLTDIRFYTSPHETIDRSGCVSLSYLTTTLGVPSLPWGGTFAYYVDQGSTLTLFEQAYDTGLGLGPLQKAAVMEELRIY